MLPIIAAAMEQTTEQDLVVAGAVILCALVAFIAVLYLNSGEKKKKRSEVDALTEGGTQFVETEDGKTVRRSTRCGLDTVVNTLELHLNA